MTRGTLRAAVRSNLSDAGVTYYSDQDINDILQDAYNEIAAKCQCIIKSVTVNQVAKQPYYDFKALGVSDYLGTTAILNNQTKFWLRDDISLRDYDRLRRDWEMWSGAPQFWAPHSLQYVAISPNLATTNGETFLLWYWAIAPTFTSDSDVPLVATDMQQMLEHYSTASLLESAEEVTKASIYWPQYASDRLKYKDRCVNLAKAGLLMRV